MREQLRNYLEDYGVSQAWVAKQLGVTRQMVHAYVKGKVNLGKDNEKRLEELLVRLGVMPSS